MKQPSEDFIGAMIGLGLVVLLPSNVVRSPRAVVYWSTVLPGAGAVVGTVVRLYRRRRARRGPIP